MKFYRIYIVIILLIAVPLISGCTNSKEILNSTKIHEVKLPLFTEGVEIVVLDQVFKDGKAWFNGKTNLPDGIQLGVTLRGIDYIAQSKATVVGGSFEVGPFSKEGGLPKTSYILEIITPIAAVQSPEIRKIVGPNGEHYKGKLVTQFASDKMIRFTQSIN